MRNMRLLWQRVRTTPHLARDVVAVVVLIALGLVSAGYILAHYDTKWPWQDRFEFSASFERAPGISPAHNQEVRIAGVPVGDVTAAEPNSDGTARLTLSIKGEHPVYDNARLVVRTKNPINEMFVELNPGGPPGKPLAEGVTIPVTQTERAIQPFEALDKLDERSRNALTYLLDEADIALANAPEHLPGGLRAVDGTLTAFQPVVERLQTRRDLIRKLVTGLSRLSAAVGGDDARLARLATSLQGTLGVLTDRDAELSATLAQLPGLTGELRNALTETKGLTAELNPALDGLQAASHELPPALRRLVKTVDEANGLVDAAAPVVRKAGPVVADLRPIVSDVDTSLAQLAPITRHLPDATARIVPWMNDLAAFVYQTSSAFSLGDANGGLGRAHLTLKLNDPTGGLQRPSTSEGGNR